MVKLIFLCRRRPDITHDRYVELLLGGHVPLALRHHPTLRQYVVNIVQDAPAGAEALDSIGELSFASLQDFHERLYDSPAGQAIVQRDVRGFMGAAHAYVTTEHIQAAPPRAARLGERSPGIKLVCALQRRPDMSHAAFVDHWLHRHVPLALAHQRRMAGYVTNVVDERLSAGGEDWDGIAELHFASDRDWHEGMLDSAAGEGVIREDLARFVARAAAYRVSEYVQRRPA